MDYCTYGRRRSKKLEARTTVETIESGSFGTWRMGGSSMSVQSGAIFVYADRGDGDDLRLSPCYSVLMVYIDY